MKCFGKFITFCLFSLVLVSQSNAMKGKGKRPLDSVTASAADTKKQKHKHPRIKIEDVSQLAKMVETVRSNYFGVCHVGDDLNTCHVKALQGGQDLIFNIEISGDQHQLRQEIFQLCLSVLQRVSDEIDELKPYQVADVNESIILFTDLLDKINLCPDVDLIDEVFQKAILYAINVFNFFNKYEMFFGPTYQNLACLFDVMTGDKINFAHQSIQDGILTEARKLQGQLKTLTGEGLTH